MIFEDNNWLNKAFTEFKINPILVGPDLKTYYNNTTPKCKPKEIYMVLVTDNRSEDLAYTAKTFFSSLRKGFTIGIRTGLIYIESDNSSYPTIQLNASSLYRGCEFIPLETENLFSYDDKDSRFFYLYGQDSEYRLKRSKPENIVGIEGKQHL